MKKLLLSLLLILSIGISQSISAFEITKDEMKKQSTSTRYLTEYTTFTFNNVGFKFTQVNPSNGQVKINAATNSAFNFYNTDAIDGLTKVTINVTDNSSTTTGTWYMSIGSATISDCATTNDIKGVYNQTAHTITFEVPKDASASYFHINLTAKGSGSLYFSSIVIDVEVPKTLGAMTVTADGTTIAEEATIAIEKGQTIEMSAENATNFVVEVGSSTIPLTATDGKASWTPTDEYADEIVIITPYMGEEAGEHIMFTLTVNKPQVGEISVKANGKDVENGGSATIYLGESITLSAANANHFGILCENPEIIEEIDPTVKNWIPDAVMTNAQICVSASYNENGVTVSTAEDFNFSLTVLAPRTDLETFEWTPSSLTLTQGEDFTAPTFNCSAEGLTIKYASSLPTVANVDELGVITLGEEIGKAEITATFDGNEQYNAKVATCNIEVLKATAVKVPQHTGMWRVVTDVNELKDGEIYTIVGRKTAGDYAMNTTVNKNNISGYNITVTDNNTFTSNETTALVVLVKQTDGYALYLSNAETPGYITCNSSGSNNYVKIAEEINENASVAEISISNAEDTKGQATIKFKGSLNSAGANNRDYFQLNKNVGSNLFSCYQQTSQAPVYFYNVLTPAPQVNVTLNSEEGYEVELFTEIEGAEIWYRIMPMTNAKKVQSREAAEEVPYEKAPANYHKVALNDDQQVDFYSVLYGRQSDYLAHSKLGGTTGINEIKTVVEQGTTEYYDLSGRRVSAPTKGIVIKKTGSKVSKVVF